MTEQAKVKRTLTGSVVSNKMNKTITVVVTRKVPHPEYGKYVSRRTKVYAHDENNVCHEGDVVVVQESRPLSKKKSWVLVEVLKKARQESVNQE